MCDMILSCNPFASFTRTNISNKSPAVVTGSINQACSVFQRVLNFGRGFASSLLKKNIEILKGAATWSVVLGVFSQGASIQTIYNSIFYPEVFEATGLIQSFRGQEFMKTAEKIGELFESTGMEIPEEFDPKKISWSSCPKAEYYRQMSNLTGQANVRHQEIIHAISNMVVFTPVVEELAFRGLIQDLLLKRLVKSVISKVAPQHASKVDSKIYTGVRILLTSVAFAGFHILNKGIMPDSYVDQQVRDTFWMGIGFGIMKETYGMASNIGAHMMQNLTAVLPSLVQVC